VPHSRLIESKHRLPRNISSAAPAAAASPHPVYSRRSFIICPSKNNAIRMSDDAPPPGTRRGSLDSLGMSSRCAGSLAPAREVIWFKSSRRSGLSTSQSAPPQPHGQGASPPRTARCRYFGQTSGNADDSHPVITVISRLLLSVTQFPDSRVLICRPRGGESHPPPALSHLSSRELQD
jgi:hypothetical protein